VQAEWRAMVGLCLVAVLAGPLFRRAEAADDLARILAGLVEPNDMAPRDGGVGDEPEAGIAKLHSASPMYPSAAAPDRLGPGLSWLSLSPLPDLAAVPRCARGTFPPASAHLRLERLPILRF
jgi:hypothetical protein